jgi:hypothetical protein
VVGAGSGQGLDAMWRPSMSFGWRSHRYTRGFLPDNATFLDRSAVLAKDQSLSGLGERR